MLRIKTKKKKKEKRNKVPVAATQCAQPAAAFTIDASVGSGKGSGVS